MLQINDRYDLALADLRDVTRSDGNPHSALSFGINTLLRGVRSNERITQDQCDELGAILDHISLLPVPLLLGDMDQAKLDDGLAALVTLCLMWSEPPDRRRGSDEMADAYAHAEMLRNSAHNICLAREIHARGERRQRAFADRYLSTAPGIFA
jgi:hypothetical protein